jgi:hypothetical protein
VASYPNHGLDGETVLGAADRGLYEAKREGRNQVRSVAAKNPPRLPKPGPSAGVAVKCSREPHGQATPPTAAHAKMRRARSLGLELSALSEFTLHHGHPPALILDFGGCRPSELRRGVGVLAALEGVENPLLAPQRRHRFDAGSLSRR